MNRIASPDELTTLADRLATAAEGKKRVLTSTTTKVRHDEAMRSPLVVFTDSEPSWKNKLQDGLENHGNVFLGRVLDPSIGCRTVDLRTPRDLREGPGPVEWFPYFRSKFLNMNTGKQVVKITFHTLCIAFLLTDRHRDVFAFTFSHNLYQSLFAYFPGNPIILLSIVFREF